MPVATQRALRLTYAPKLQPHTQRHGRWSIYMPSSYRYLLAVRYLYNPKTVNTRVGTVIRTTQTLLSSFFASRFKAFIVHSPPLPSSYHPSTVHIFLCDVTSFFSFSPHPGLTYTSLCSLLSGSYVVHSMVRIFFSFLLHDV